MIDEISRKAECYDPYDPSNFPPPFDEERWERLRDRVIDELAKGGGITLSNLANIAHVEEGQLQIWLRSPEGFNVFGRRVGEKSKAESIADALENAFHAIDAEGINPQLRCPVRVRTSVVEVIVKSFKTARSLCEFVEVCAPPGVGKTEGRAEAIASFRKDEGFFCPVWSITLDETCVTIKAILTLIARAVCEGKGFDDRSEFALSQSIIDATKDKRGVLAIDEGQHLADVMKKLGIPIINQLRSFVDRGLFGIVYFGNGEIYRRLKASKGSYNQILTRMQDFRVEISGYDPSKKITGTEGNHRLTRKDVSSVAAAWGVAGVEKIAWCLSAAATPGALRTMTNIFRRVLVEYDEITITNLNKIRRF